MKIWSGLPFKIVRLFRTLRSRLKIHELRLRGVDIADGAFVHHSAVLEPSGGTITIGEGTYIDSGVILRPLGGLIKIGKNCSINAYSVLYGGGGLEIGDNTRIAAHTVIIPSNHIFADRDIPIKDQGLSQIGIVVENDVWVGAGTRILDGVTVNTGAVIGAGSVVTKSISSNTVVVGVPAKQIAFR
ncbi:acyltransferase [Pontixanthobacter sp.]|uniref:acyltransferase n=1 Tax=Pontixanthobacter sp. TaxID=2792078 RepID=UPI003C7EA873